MGESAGGSFLQANPEVIRFFNGNDDMFLIVKMLIMLHIRNTYLELSSSSN